MDIKSTLTEPKLASPKASDTSRTWSHKTLVGSASIAGGGFKSAPLHSFPGKSQSVPVLSRPKALINGTAFQTQSQITASIHSDISRQTSSSGCSENLDLSGFEQLENCSGIISVKTAEGLDLSQAILWEMYFKIFNHRGQHIFSAGEVRDHWYRFSHWEFCIYVFTSSGRPLFTIAQRSVAQCNVAQCSKCGGGDERKIWLVHKEADEWLNQKAKLTADEDDVENRAHVHVSLISGAFLGHIWNGGNSFVVYDIEYNPVLNLYHKDVSEKGSRAQSALDFEIPAAAPSLQMAQGDVLYKIYVETSRVGDVQINVNTERNLELARKDCFSANFPKDIEREDKILILAFVLFQQRNHPFCRKIFGFLANCYFLALLSFLLFCFLSGILLWKTNFFAFN